MAYAKSFQATITIFPDFKDDGYCQYFKEKISNWITDCFNAYIDFFNVTVSQANGKAILYKFDAESGDEDIDLKKIWKAPRGMYTIDIHGSGIINYGIKDRLEPPLGISEEILDKVYLKYQETSSVYPPKIITYGKNPITRITNVPIEYTFDAFDNEDWEDGTLDIDVYSEKWKLLVKTTSKDFLSVLDIFEEIQKINKNKLMKIYSDEFENIIELSGQFILKKEDKNKYKEILKKLTQYFLEDDFFEITEINMNFIAESENIFYFESYFLNDFLGAFNVRHIKI